MTSNHDAIDARDLAHLDAVRDLWAHADPVPAGLTDRLKFELSVRAMHAEVAEIIDSALLATRSGDQAVAEPTPTESVTFSAPSVSLMISSSPAQEPDCVHVDGWVTRPGAEVDVVHASGIRTVTADRDGRFVLHDVVRGPVHFVVRANPRDPQSRPVITPTVEL